MSSVNDSAVLGRRAPGALQPAETRVADNVTTTGRDLAKVAAPPANGERGHEQTQTQFCASQFSPRGIGWGNVMTE
jgi:hypothetical protein